MPRTKALSRRPTKKRAPRRTRTKVGVTKDPMKTRVRVPGTRDRNELSQPRWLRKRRSKGA